MSHFGWVVHKVIEQSDIILEVLDARFIEETRNRAIEEAIKKKKKILIYVLNKCDLADKNGLDQVKKELDNCVFVSSTKYFGIKMLKDRIFSLAKQNKIKKPKVGVIGYPNTGKSSIINALNGRSSARTSPEAGFTKGTQFLRLSKEIMMLDTPGVISGGKNKTSGLVLIGAKNPSSMEDPDLAVISLLKNCPGMLEAHYGVEHHKMQHLIIEAIALKLNMKKKGNLPDVDRVSRKILIDWQSGKIRK